MFWDFLFWSSKLHTVIHFFITITRNRHQKKFISNWIYENLLKDICETNNYCYYWDMCQLSILKYHWTHICCCVRRYVLWLALWYNLERREKLKEKLTWISSPSDGHSITNFEDKRWIFSEKFTWEIIKTNVRECS